MSDNEDDIPDMQTAQKLVEQFAEITETDEALAQFYLQDREWNLEKSINDYFRDVNKKAGVHVRENKHGENDVIIVLDDDKSNVAAAATAIASSNLCGEQTSHESSIPKPIVDVSTLKFVTWNIDGLDDRNRTIRMKAVCKIIETIKPDIVHLQEVVPETLSYIRRKLQDYKCVTSDNDGCEYFIVTLLSIETVEYVSHASIHFPSSVMGRNLLSVTLKIGRVTLRTMNTHLESTKDHANERLHQLKISFKEIGNVDSKQSVLFAGDLNLRDTELTRIGGLPDGIEDLWRTCGLRKECEFTWDASRNLNISLNSRFKPRLRFDRVYLRRSEPQTISPKYFGLIGIERIRLSQCFPSDHFGIFCEFDINSDSR